MALLTRPSIVIPLNNPGVQELINLGAKPEAFRHENPRSIVMAIAVRLEDNQIIYGAGKIVAIENGIRMGSTSLLSLDDQWFDGIQDLESHLFTFFQGAKPTFEAKPEPGAQQWRRILALLGGKPDPGRLPDDWRRQLQLAAGLHQIKLDVRVNPEANRPKVIHDLKTSPPDALLVWSDWVAHPEAFLQPYQSARPAGYAELMGTPDRSMSFADLAAELRLHLWEIESKVSKKLEIHRVTTWAEAAKEIEKLVGPHFYLTDRARRMLPNNPYPKPARMLNFMRRLSEVAERYHAASGEIGGRLTDFAMEYRQIEIALFDGNLTPPPMTFDSVTLRAEPHVKVDDHKSPDQCGRIYFAVDRSAFRFVVDHIGLHDYG
ncbi:hypothetical protein [Actinomadura livida]|nr:MULTISPECIES: hypothetical protein [Actinomadura]MBB4778823.1 hypothetical protein [Actinomadura catellatispora]